jgi:hypothetical protein
MRLSGMERVMSKRIYISIETPVREGLSWDERWSGADNGLITCWEVGRQQAIRDPELAERAKNNELPSLDWKGGVEKKLKAKIRFGCLNYLAAWQGLRGDDLDIDMSREVELVCTKTKQRVVFTPDQSKYAEP